MGNVKVSVYRHTIEVEEGSMFTVGPSYGMDYTPGRVKVDYLGPMCDDIKNSDTDWEVYTDQDGYTEDTVWVGFHYTGGEGYREGGNRIQYVPAELFVSNIYSL